MPKRPAVSRKRSAKKFRILVASDGSPRARAAVAAAVAFPWPTGAEASAVVATGDARTRWSPSVSVGLDAAFREVAVETEQALRRRWPKAATAVVDGPPADVILKSARGAKVVVLGSHGYSRLERWMLGSVSRAVVRRAGTSVLVVKEHPKECREVVVAYDGSNHARRAIDLVASLTVPAGGRVTVLSLVDPVEPQVPALLPRRMRGALAAEVKAFTSARLAKSRRALERAARPLVAAGWRVRLDARAGIASRDVPAITAALHADLLVLGAQGTGWKRLLLGSVVEATLDHAGVSTLIVR